jgi:TonB family protein
VQEYRPDPNWVDNTPDPDPTEAVQVDQEAQCLNMPQVLGMVQYPPSARSEGVRGRVYLKVLVDPRGKVKRYVVRRSPDARLTNALVQVLDQLRYRPAFRQGQPIKSWEEFSFTFQ